MFVSEDAEAAGVPFNAAALTHTLDLLRPYGGVAYLGASGGKLAFMANEAAAAGVDQVSTEARTDHLFASRGGPLTGAGEWTHQHRDPASTLMSEDQRVKLPLGLLWFGGPNNHNILPRHSGGPRPHVVNGRIIYLGVENVAARCVYTGRQLWDVPFPGIGHPFTNLELEERWREGRSVYMTNIPGATYIGSPIVSLADSIYLRYEGEVHRLDPVSGETTARFSLPGTPVDALYDDPDAPDWGHIHIQGDYLVTTTEPHLFEDQVLGWTESYSGTSSKRLAVMDRHTGEVLWEREAKVGFRHNAIISTDDRIFIIDGLSELALEHLARRGAAPEDSSSIHALDIRDGSTVWSSDSEVFGTFLLYSPAHDILVEGGSQDLRRRLEDEPRTMTARNGSDGGVLWESGGNFTLPGAVHGDMLIPGRPGTARSILTGEQWLREQPHTGETVAWEYSRTYGCNTVSASPHLLFYRSGSAGFYDMEHESGTGNFGGFRSGCTSNLVAADGVLTALDFTRTCTCSYQHQTSLAMVHMPGDNNIELWTRHDASAPNPERHGINFGAPGRRVDHASGTVWFNEDGRLGRHASAIVDTGGAINWVASFAREFDDEDDTAFTVYDLLEANYTVRLHFAELAEGVEPGERVFDVLINGNEVLSGFDIAAETGGSLRGVVKEFSVDASMTLDFELRASEDSGRAPLLSGIELIANGIEVAQAR
jgi:outer membrane protein assembly factor BamB